MTTTPPANFVKRDWEAPEHNATEPRDRFDVHDGPTVGGIETAWQPNSGLSIDLPELGSSRHGLDMTLDQTRKLRDDLTALLEQLDQ